MTLRKLTKTLLMATACSAAIAACGDDDGTAGGGVGGGVGGGTGVGGGVISTTLNLNLRVAQLIPDAFTPADPDAGLPTNPGVRLCLKAGASWLNPMPLKADGPLGIPAGAITSYSATAFPNVTTDVVVYLASEFDAATADVTAPSAQCADAEADVGLNPVLNATIVPSNAGLVDGGHYTVLLSGLRNRTVFPVSPGNPVPIPCLSATGVPEACPVPGMTILADDLAPTTGAAKVRVVNAIANGGGLEVCTLPALHTVAGPTPTSATPSPLLFEAPATVGSPVAVGDASTYFDRTPLTGTRYDVGTATNGTGYILIAAQRTTDGDGGDGGPCSGLAVPSLARAQSTIPTPTPEIFGAAGPFNGMDGAALAVENLVAGEVVTVFLYGLADQNPADANRLGTAIIPIRDVAPATP